MKSEVDDRPKTADGVIIKLGMKLYFWNGFHDSHILMTPEIVEKIEWSEEDEEYLVNGDSACHYYTSKALAQMMLSWANAKFNIRRTCLAIERSRSKSLHEHLRYYLSILSRSWSTFVNIVLCYSNRS